MDRKATDARDLFGVVSDCLDGLKRDLDDGREIDWKALEDAFDAKSDLHEFFNMLMESVDIEPEDVKRVLNDVREGFTLPEAVGKMEVSHYGPELEKPSRWAVMLAIEAIEEKIRIDVERELKKALKGMR